MFRVFDVFVFICDCIYAVNQAPFIVGETEIRAQINQTVTVTYIYGDGNGDDVQLEVKDMPPDAVEMSFPGSNWTITWAPTDFTAVSLRSVTCHSID